MTTSVSERGVITQWEAERGWGSIRLENGTELRFNTNACASGLDCTVGAQVWVAAHVPYVGGQRRATSVQGNARGTLSRLELAKRRAELDQELDDRIMRELGSPLFKGDENVLHVDELLEELGITLRTSFLDDPDETLGFAYTPDVLGCWVPFDPCLIAFGNRDGDVYCFFCHPTLLARGEVPVVYWDHEGNPVKYLAPNFDEFLRKHATSAKRSEWLYQHGYRPTTSAKVPASIVKQGRALLADTTTGDRAFVELYNNCLGNDDAALAVAEELLAYMHGHGWPAPLVARMEKQLTWLEAKCAFEARYAVAKAAIEEAHRAAHPEVYADA